MDLLVGVVILCIGYFTGHAIGYAEARKKWVVS